MSDSDRDLRISETAADLGWSEYQVRGAIADGRLDCYRIGRAVRVRRESFNRGREAQARPSAAMRQRTQAANDKPAGSSSATAGG